MSEPNYDPSSFMDDTNSKMKPTVDPEKEKEKTIRSLVDILTKLLKMDLTKELKELNENLEKAKKTTEKDTAERKKKSKSGGDSSKKVDNTKKVDDKDLVAKLEKALGKDARTGFVAQATSRFSSLLDSKDPAKDLLKSAPQAMGKIASLVAPKMSAMFGPILGPIADFAADIGGKALGNMSAIKQAGFQTQGIGGADLDQQQKALNEYKVGWSEVWETNQNIDVIQKQQLNNLKRGIRNVKTLNKVTSTGLGTASLLGSSAEETANFFADMHQNLGMSVMDLRNMGSGLRDIAKSTGVTGDNLIKVARNSESFIKNMRNAGVLTSEAANNVTRLLAEASKTGTSEGIQNLLSVITKGTLNNNGDPKTRDYLLAATQGNSKLAGKLQSGTLAGDKAGMKQLAEGMKKIMKDFTGGRALEDIDPQELGFLSQKFEELTGRGLKQAELEIENITKANRSFGERFDELEKTKSGRTGDQTTQLKKDLITSQTTQYLTDLNKAL